MTMLWCFKMLQAGLNAVNFPLSSLFVAPRLFRATGCLIIYTYLLWHENREDTNMHTTEGI